MREIVPLTRLERRPPEAGRLRMGVKSGEALKSIDHWRFTSPYRDVLDQLAGLYGGQVRPWHDKRASPPDQFELLSEAAEVNVYLIPDGMSIWYEEWSGGGCVRRCDGIDCETPDRSGEDLVTVPCMCVANNLRVCDPHTRLQVILPELSFRGVWRMETKGWNAAHELPGIVDMIQALADRGQMVQAKLGIEKRNQVTRGRKRNFVVPRISIAQSVLELQAGMADVRSIGSGVATTQVALPSRTNVHDPSGSFVEHIDDPDVDDAEVLDDELVEIEAALAADAYIFGLDERRFVEAVRAQVGAVKDADPGQRERLREASRKMRAGALVPLGFTASNKIQWEATR